MTPCRINVPNYAPSTSVCTPNFSSPLVKKRTSIHMRCPLCKRRAFDISDFPNESIDIELKCPQCNKVVLVTCNEKNVMA